ncbi:MAG TPA: YcaO-like family protein [Candidatus Deferrimicrobium sp.]|nr:YcaO-like family protein [Candidatus Deferrimicrobium sp.]
MNLTYYPYPTHLIENIFKRICSEHVGVIQSLMVGPVKYTDNLDIKSVSGQMPYYHKVLIHPDLNVQYHLTGYGTFYEEAIIRLVGEAIERYSLMATQYTLTERFRYASYNQIKQDGAVMPFDYLRTFSDSDYEKLNKGEFKGLKKLEKDDIVGWIKCPSLFKPGLEIWTPLQLLFVGYRVNQDVKEVGFTPGFSTGTAAHATLEKALCNAILEFIEIDALMINWYTRRKAPAIAIDDLTILKQYASIFGEKSNYDVLSFDLSILKEVDAHVFGTAIMNKKEERPFIVYGAQGHLDPVKGFYRSFMESMAIAFLGIYGPLYSPKEYFNDPGCDTFTDLDKNVSFFAVPSNAQKKRDLIYSMGEGKKLLSSMKSHESGETKQDLIRLISQLSKVSEYAVYLDVTPPETRDKGWYVMRTFIPELVTMCVPGVPYSNHPRFAQFGGITNEFPHPLP